MIEHFRRQFATKYGARASVELRGCFGPAWQKIAESADMFVATNAVEVRAIDEFDYLGVNHFHTVVAKHFDLVYPKIAAQEELLREEARRSFLRYLKDLKDFRDGMSHPVSRDFTPLDALFVMRAALRTIEPIDRATADRIAALMEDLRLAPAVTQATADKAEAAVMEPRTPLEALEGLLLELGPVSVYEAFAQLLRSNAEMLATAMPEDAAAHSKAAQAIEDLLKAETSEDRIDPSGSP